MYRTHAGDVAAFALRLGVHPASIPDCVQEVFMTLYRRRDDYDPARPLLAYIFGITRRVAFRQRRSVARRMRRRSALRSFGFGGQGLGAGAYADREEARILMEGFVEELADQDPEVARVFVMRDLAGFTIAEIVRDTGLSRDAVRYRVDSARSRLRETLDGGGAPRSHASLVPAWGVVAAGLERSSGWGLLGGLGASAASAGGVVGVAAAVGLMVMVVTRPDAPVVADPSSPIPLASQTEVAATSVANSDRKEPRPEPPSEEPVTRAGSRTASQLTTPPAVPVEAPPSLSESAPGQDQLAREVALLEQARTALGVRDFASAEASIAEHGAKYSRGFLADGRVRLELRLACESGRPDRVPKILEQWRVRHPGSRLPPHLSASCPTSGPAGEEEVK